MESEEEFRKHSDVTIATIRSTAKRDSVMRILTFLNNNSDACTITEISDELDMDWGTAKNSLTKLMESGFIELVEDKMDARCRYYQIADKKATEKAIEYYEDRQRKLKKQGAGEPIKLTEVEEVE